MRNVKSKNSRPQRPSRRAQSSSTSIRNDSKRHVEMTEEGIAGEDAHQDNTVISPLPSQPTRNTTDLTCTNGSGEDSVLASAFGSILNRRTVLLVVVGLMFGVMIGLAGGGAILTPPSNNNKPAAGGGGGGNLSMGTWPVVATAVAPPAVKKPAIDARIKASQKERTDAPLQGNDADAEAAFSPTGAPFPNHQQGISSSSSSSTSTAALLSMNYTTTFLEVAVPTYTAEAPAAGRGGTAAAGPADASPQGTNLHYTTQKWWRGTLCSDVSRIPKNASYFLRSTVCGWDRVVVRPQRGAPPSGGSELFSDAEYSLHSRGINRMNATTYTQNTWLPHKATALGFVGSQQATMLVGSTATAPEIVRFNYSMPPWCVAEASADHCAYFTHGVWHQRITHKLLADTYVNLRRVRAKASERDNRERKGVGDVMFAGEKQPTTNAGAAPAAATPDNRGNEPPILTDSILRSIPRPVCGTTDAVSTPITAHEFRFAEEGTVGDGRPNPADPSSFPFTLESDVCPSTMDYMSPLEMMSIFHRHAWRDGNGPSAAGTSTAGKTSSSPTSLYKPHPAAAPIETPPYGHGILFHGDSMVRQSFHNVVGKLRGQSFISDHIVSGDIIYIAYPTRDVLVTIGHGGEQSGSDRNAYCRILQTWFGGAVNDPRAKEKVSGFRPPSMECPPYVDAPRTPGPPTGPEVAEEFGDDGTKGQQKGSSGMNKEMNANDHIPLFVILYMWDPTPIDRDYINPVPERRTETFAFTNVNLRIGGFIYWVYDRSPYIYTPIHPLTGFLKNDAEAWLEGRHPITDRYKGTPSASSASAGATTSSPSPLHDTRRIVWYTAPRATMPEWAHLSYGYLSGRNARMRRWALNDKRGRERSVAAAAATQSAAGAGGPPHQLYGRGDEEYHLPLIHAAIGDQNFYPVAPPSTSSNPNSRRRVAKQAIAQLAEQMAIPLPPDPSPVRIVIVADPSQQQQQQQQEGGGAAAAEGGGALPSTPTAAVTTVIPYPADARKDWVYSLVFPLPAIVHYYLEWGRKLLGPLAGGGSNSGSSGGIASSGQQGGQQSSTSRRPPQQRFLLDYSGIADVAAHHGLNRSHDNLHYGCGWHTRQPDHITQFHANEFNCRDPINGAMTQWLMHMLLAMDESPLA